MLEEGKKMIEKKVLLKNCLFNVIKVIKIMIQLFGLFHNFEILMNLYYSNR